MTKVLEPGEILDASESPEVIFDAVSGLNFHRVYSLASPPFPLDATIKKHINKEFARAAAQLANKIAGAGKGKHKKNRELARLLTLQIRACDYDVFSRVDPNYPEAMRAKNLVFRLHEGKDDAAPTPYAAKDFVVKPEKKISLPFHMVNHANREFVQSYIPGELFSINLPVNPIALKQIRAAKNLVQALTSTRLKPSVALCAEEMASAQSHMAEVAAGRVVRKPNRDRALTARLSDRHFVRMGAVRVA